MRVTARVTAIVLLALILLIGCENPQNSDNDALLYKGKAVQDGRAPFLVDQNSLAKDAAGTLVIEESSAAGTVYGLASDTYVYEAAGGEVLPKDTWVDNISAEPIEVGVTSELVLTFEELTTVTLIDAINVFYVDVNGDTLLFSGSGVVSTTEISTGLEGSVTLISSTKFSIGGDSGDFG